jgi:hypothetical protein
MKRHLILSIFSLFTSLGISQNDKFANAILGLKNLDYYVINLDSDTLNYRIMADHSKFWLNERIEICHKINLNQEKIQLINLKNLTTIKNTVVKSRTEIASKTFAKAELWELEFQNTIYAIENEKIISQLNMIAMECINKAPWTCWRIDNKLYFIITSATLFGQEIPKIKNKMNEILK